MGAGADSTSTALPLPFSFFLASFASLFCALASFLSLFAFFLSRSGSDSALEVAEGATEEEAARVGVEGVLEEETTLVRFLGGGREAGVSARVEVEAVG